MSVSLSPKNNCPDVFEVVFDANGKYIGDIYREDGGYYAFEPEGRGYWSSWMLHIIADKLDELNEQWNKTVLASMSGTCSADRPLGDLGE